jgi:uncharacterized membrane protein
MGEGENKILAQHNNGGGRFKWIATKARHLFRILPRSLASYLAGGLIIIIPLAVTLWLLIWFFNLIDGLLSPILVWVVGRYVPGLGFAVIIILIMIIGFLGMVIGHRRFFGLIEFRITRIPVIGYIYGGIREILNSFNTTNTQKFMETVLVEYPRKGIYSMGFVTKVSQDKKGNKYFNVYIPSAPTPAGGYLQIVPESEIVHTSLSISDALKFIVSVGWVSREDVGDILTQVQELEKGKANKNLIAKN